MVVYIEKDVADNISSETIISHNNFKIWKLVKENFKTLYIWICFYFVMLIIQVLLLINFLILSVFNEHPKKTFGATIVS